LSNVLPSHFYAQLYDIQAVDFVLLELNLYLNTHPNDLPAIQQFNRFAQQRRSLVQPFETEFGPLLHAGHSYSKQPWEWINAPWPWQV
jgi:spore coat protein JB